MAEEEIKEEIKEETPSIEEETTTSANIEESTISEEAGQKEEENSQDIKQTQEEEKKEAVQKKVPFLNKILFVLVGFLLIVLIIGTVLFFMGFFDAKEEIKNEEVQKQEKIVNEDNSFNIKDINSKKLNQQLLLLTNKNIIAEEENNKREKLEQEKKIKQEEEKKRKESLALEEEKISKEKALLENKKIELEKQKEELEILKNEAINLRDEMINSKKILEMKKEETIAEVAEVKVEEEAEEEIIEIKEEIKEKTPMSENKFVSLINIAKIKGSLYKSYLDKITSINSDVKLCRDDLNRIELYYGPFEDNSIRNDLYKKLQENGIENSYEVELTKEEFDKRCNY